MDEGPFRDRLISDAFVMEGNTAGSGGLQARSSTGRASWSISRSLSQQSLASHCCTLTALILSRSKASRMIFAKWHSGAHYKNDSSDSGVTHYTL